MRRKKGKIIAIVGNIASGKSTLSRLLAKALGAHLIKEKFLDNPYLKKQYNEDTKAFENFIWFFNQQLRQYHRALEFKKLGRVVVMDCVLMVSQEAFRRLYFKGDDAKLLRDLALNAAGRLPLPDLMIFLVGSDEFILRRLRKRGRKLEANLTDQTIRDLSRRYSEVLGEYKGKKLLIDIEKGDFKNKSVLADIAYSVKALA